MNLLAVLQKRWLDALQGWVEPDPNWADLVRRGQDAKFGDYQINGAMPVAKKLGKPAAARDVAKEIVARLQLDDLFLPPEIAGPGFINLKVRPEWLAAQPLAALRDERLGVSNAAQPKKYVIDFSGPNVAKPMHVGHIRSTVIGDSLSKLLSFLGHEVVRDNHIGDWGTQFGMIIYGYRHLVHRAAYEQSPVQELARLYRQVRQLVDYHQGKADHPRKVAAVARTEGEIAQLKGQIEVAARDPQEAKSLKKSLRRLEDRLEDQTIELRLLTNKLVQVETNPKLLQLAKDHADIGKKVLEETAKLHNGDPQNLALWKEFLPPCRAEMETIYKRLNVQFDVTLGESFYHAMLKPVVDDLLKLGLARESQGAIGVFLDDSDAPFLIRKQDGAFLYATTDLATIRYRMETWKPDAMLYVVDSRQGLHFEQLFATVRKWNPDWAGVELQHIKFGTVLGEDGTPFKTRSGDTVGLESLLDDAVAAAGKVVASVDDRNPAGPQLDAAARARVADVVGTGAVKYGDLSQNRESDYKFSFEKMVALDGNTAPYLQYAYARTRSVQAKGDVDMAALVAAAEAVRIESPSERALAMALSGFEEALQQAAADYRPNLLANYLWEVANLFSSFWEKDSILKAPDEATRRSRLLLCEWTGRTLKQGLHLLGIDVVDKM